MALVVVVVVVVVVRSEGDPPHERHSHAHTTRTRHAHVYLSAAHTITHLCSSLSPHGLPARASRLRPCAAPRGHLRRVRRPRRLALRWLPRPRLLRPALSGG